MFFEMSAVGAWYLFSGSLLPDGGTGAAAGVAEETTSCIDEQIRLGQCRVAGGCVSHKRLRKDRPHIRGSQLLPSWNSTIRDVYFVCHNLVFLLPLLGFSRTSSRNLENTTGDSAALSHFSGRRRDSSIHGHVPDVLQ